MVKYRFAGIGGSSLRDGRSNLGAFNLRFEFLAGVERHHATRRDGISSPVFGLRPGRCGFHGIENAKPDSLTISPFSSDKRISSKTTRRCLSPRVIQTHFSNSNSADQLW